MVLWYYVHKLFIRTKSEHTVAVSLSCIECIEIINYGNNRLFEIYLPS